MRQVNKRQVHFAEYKAIKDEIIEISEQRFENILTRRLKEFKAELMGDLNKRFEGIDKRFEDMEKRFEDMEKRFDKRFDSIKSETRWLIGLLFILLSLLMTVFKFIK